MIISEFIYSWLKDIVVLFIIITLVDLIMPKGQMKRYMNFIIGIILIFMVISPFLNLLSLDFNLKDSNINISENQQTHDIDFTKEQTEKIENLYREKISSQIDILVEKEGNYKVNDLDIEIDRSDLYFGEIININMELIEKDEEKKDSTIEKVSISKVENVFGKHEDTIVKENSNQFNQLKETISRDLGVSIDLITIYIKG